MQSGGLEELERELRDLPRRPAPVGLAERVVAEAERVRFAPLETVHGWVLVAYGPRGVRFLAPGVDEAAFVTRYRARLGGDLVRDDAPPARLLGNVRRALAGVRRAGERVPLDLETLGAFERAVLLEARAIPRGQVRTYGWLAKQLGRPSASRAVGLALGRNPVPLLVPCHRVVGSSGSLTGYAFGLEMKRRVLEQEGVDPRKLEASARPATAHAKSVARPERGGSGILGTW